MSSGNWGFINNWEYFNDIEYNVERALEAISKGFDVNAKDDFFASTALHNAVFRGKLEIASKLIENGADVNALDDYLRSPLHYAAERGNKAMIKVLLDKGANASAIDINGEVAYDLSKDFDAKNISNPEAEVSDHTNENISTENLCAEKNSPQIIANLEATASNLTNDISINMPKRSYYLIKQIEQVLDHEVEEINSVHDNISWNMTLACTTSLVGLAAATGTIYYCYVSI
jgi:ankyrin repeat protein